MKLIRKRDGDVVAFNLDKITTAILKGFLASKEISTDECETISNVIAADVLTRLDAEYADPVYIENVQDVVERTIMANGYQETAKGYILYRAERERERNKNTPLMRTLDKISGDSSAATDLMRENANIDGKSPMGTMLKIGSESAKAYNETYLLSPKIRQAHKDGDIHIHDFDFLTLTTTCTQIDLTRLFKDGFSTGHGFLREPNSIASYGALAAIAIQANQNDQHGGQSVPSFDRDMAPGVKKTFAKNYAARLKDAIEDMTGIDDDKEPVSDDENLVKQILDDVEAHGFGKPALGNDALFDGEVALALESSAKGISLGCIKRAVVIARKRAVKETDKQTHQAMEGFVHNLNSMHSRAGAQTPFSSINYGTDTSPEGRMVVKNLLLATMEGLGKGETPIFPIQIFRMKNGVNMNEGEPNYDLFKLALQCSAKRMFPNFSFQDAPFNAQYYKEGRPETEVSYMGCRTRVIGNIHDTEREIAFSRGNLSFTSINLPRLAILSNGSYDVFKHLLDEKMELVLEQLFERFEIQASKSVFNYPFLMGQGVWLDSDKLKSTDNIREVLKHGTLSIGFIGLAETLTALFGQHHGESEESQRLGLEIISRMRDFCDKKTADTQMNITLIATPAEGLSGRFVRMDNERFGPIPGVTDKEYYTNSFHVPVGYKLPAFKKIELEAPYHALTNAGHISYIEVDGNIANNTEAFEKVVKYMAKCGMGYGAVNHPLDRDPDCGYNGVIGDECPGCGRKESEGGKFERIRRITGYLVGDRDERFNDAKKAEERDRVKHV
jgi:ribonucleoside-triphosphate reductase